MTMKLETLVGKYLCTDTRRVVHPLLAVLIGFSGSVRAQSAHGRPFLVELHGKRHGRTGLLSGWRKRLECVVHAIEG